MIGKTILHYKIIEKLGEGGMGVVYKAEDIKLDRLVALKFLPMHLAHLVEPKKRFEYEAKAASALDHPNICNIHEITETEEGQIFIVMAFYEAETLKDRIEKGPLPIEEAIDISTQIAQGLERAHSKGIFHRDIKPANILITEFGEVKIVDFGLAKLSSYAQITEDDQILGTTAYMSPEQSRGFKIDQRTDLWSLGVVLYEILTGERPFKGYYDHAIVYSIIHEEPESVTDLRKQTPRRLAALVKKALEKEPEARFQNAEEFLVELKSLAVASTSKSGSKKGKALPRIAVLPLADLSREKDQGYFCEGMAEEIMSALAGVRDLRVVGRTSTFAIRHSTVK